MKDDVKLEIVARMPTFFIHCRHCMTAMKLCNLPTISSQLEECPRDMKDFYFKLFDIAQSVFRDFGERVGIRVIDEASILGLWKVIRYRIKRTPAFIVNGRKIFETMPSYEELRRGLINSVADRSSYSI